MQGKAMNISSGVVMALLGPLHAGFPCRILIFGDSLATPSGCFYEYIFTLTRYILFTSQMQSKRILKGFHPGHHQRIKALKHRSSATLAGHNHHVFMWLLKSYTWFQLQRG